MFWIASKDYTSKHLKKILLYNIRDNRMDILIERRKEVYRMMKETSNIEDYRRYERDYKNIGARLFHERNKNNEDYKRMKYENLKRCLKNNEDYYENIKEKNRIRNKENYILKKDLRKKIYDNNEKYDE